VYQFVLLKGSATEAMKRFSTFLALPSATIRSMAARQLMVRGCAAVASGGVWGARRSAAGVVLPGLSRWRPRCLTLPSAITLPGGRR
jgi:hypothetical protein